MSKITRDDFLNFKSELLNVDFISFNFSKLDKNEISELALYFDSFGFNSYKKNSQESFRQDVRVDFKNKFQLTFVVNIPYQREIVQLQLAGINSKRFYYLIKQGLIKLQELTQYDFNLSRLDIYYDRLNKRDDQIENLEFINLCFRQMQQYHPNKNLSVEKNKKGLLFKIGSRRSSKYYRVYNKNNNNILRFEFEIKIKIIKDLNYLLIKNQFNRFEELVSYNFFKESFQLFYSCNAFCHLDWLMARLRPYQNRIKLISNSSMFQSHYLEKILLEDFERKIDLITFFKFLVYAGRLPYKTGILGSTQYRFIKFRVSDFLNFNPQLRKNNYQLKKLIKFFNELQRNSLIHCFSDSYYRGLVTIPEIKLSKNRYNSWIAEIWIADELFNYLHPFIFQDLFNKKLKKDEFQVLFEIITSFSSESLRKELNIKDFMTNYTRSSSNQRKTQIKRYFIHYITVLHQQNKINSEILLLPSNKVCKIEDMEISHFLQTTTIILFENIDVAFE